MPLWSRSEYARRMSAQEAGTLVQVIGWSRDERPVGRGMLVLPGHPEWSVSAHREGCPEIRDVHIEPAWRRSGVATAIVARLEDACRSLGFERIGLSVGTAPRYEPARALYDGLGYRPAHGPFVASTDLDGDEGPIPVGAVLVYLLKQLG